MVMASRVGYGLAEADLLPRAFARVLPNRRTPWVSIVVVAAATIGLTLIGDVSTLAETTVLLLILVFLSANVSLLVLKKDKVDHPHFSVPRIVPVLAIIASLVLLTQQTGIVWLGSAGYVVVGRCCTSSPAPVANARSVRPGSVRRPDLADPLVSAGPRQDSWRSSG